MERYQYAAMLIITRQGRYGNDHRGGSAVGIKINLTLLLRDWIGSR